MSVVRSLLAFAAAGLCEIAGGYLLWLWLREGRTAWLAPIGAAVLFLYGVIPTFQPSTFGRAYAAYGGVFVALSVAWGWKVEGVAPDRYDLIGAAVVLAGVALMMYAPRPV